MNTAQPSRNQKNPPRRREEREVFEIAFLRALRVFAVKISLTAGQGFCVSSTDEHRSVFICVHLWLQFCAIYTGENPCQRGTEADTIEPESKFRRGTNHENRICRARQHGSADGEESAESRARRDCLQPHAEPRRRTGARVA